jgi:hypothetical protein
MKVLVGESEFEFNNVMLNITKRNTLNVFFNKNNKSVAETFAHKKYKKLEAKLGEEYKEHLQRKLGEFLRILKENNDPNYRCFLNKYGDENFCEFTISEHLNDKGVYCFEVDGKIKYIGRCVDNFKKRINQGYGKIHPKNCFIDGQTTNCRVNSLINTTADVQFGVYLMNDSSDNQIKQFEKAILKSNSLDWNSQKS